MFAAPGRSIAQPLLRNPFHRTLARGPCAGGAASVVAMRGFIDRDGLHLGEVDGDRHFLFDDHQLIGFDHMLKPAIGVLIFNRIGREIKRLQAELDNFARAIEFVHFLALL
jgi:hypothetical protein